MATVEMENVERNKSLDDVLSVEMMVRSEDGKEYICLVWNSETESMEMGGSKLGLDFLSRNHDIRDRFLQFCGLYKAQGNKEVEVEGLPLSEAQDDNRETNNSKSEGHQLTTETEDTNNDKKQVRRKRQAMTRKHTRLRPTRRSARRREKQVYSAVNAGASNKSTAGPEDDTDLDDVQLGNSYSSDKRKCMQPPNAAAAVNMKEDDNDDEDDDTPAFTEEKKERKKCDRGLFRGFSTGTFNCDVCLETFQAYAKVLKHHVTEHTRKKYFPCRHCGKVLSCKGGWFRHNMLLHNEFAEKVHKCEFCGQVFAAANRCRKHVEVCRTFYNHGCKLCGQKFISSDEVETHMLTHHTSGGRVIKLKCSECEEVFGSEEARQIHEKCHSDPNNQCGLCKKWFLSVEACARHRKSHDEENLTAKKVLICEYCSKVFKHANAYHKHIKLHRNTNMGQKFECQVCRKQCKSAETYKFHMRLHLPNDEKPYKCSYCGKGFGTGKGLGIHEKTHSDKMHAFCEICGRGFKEERLLKVHIRRAHTGEKPYRCEICDKSFFTSSGRKEHVLAMHDTCSIICEQCGKVLPSRARLAVHKRTHTQTTTPVECEVCKRVFNTKQLYMTHYVARHLSLQDADKFPKKVHSCPICQKLFLCKYKLKTHIRTHTGQKPELCEYCNKGFSDRANLLAHIKIHKDEKPFRCEVCPKQFIHRRALRKHMESHDASGIGPLSEEGLEKTKELNNLEGECSVNQLIPNSVKSLEIGASCTSSQESHVNVDVQYIPMQDMQIVWRNSTVGDTEAQVSTAQLQNV